MTQKHARVIPIPQPMAANTYAKALEDAMNELIGEGYLVSLRFEVPNITLVVGQKVPPLAFGIGRAQSEEEVPEVSVLAASANTVGILQAFAPFPDEDEELKKHTLERARLILLQAGTPRLRQAIHELDTIITHHQSTCGDSSCPIHRITSSVLSALREVTVSQAS